MAMNHVYVLFLVTGDLLKSWTLLSRTVLLTLAVVVVMNWIVAPHLTKLLKPWLFSGRAVPKVADSRIRKR